IDQEIIYNEDYKKYFDEFDRVLSNPTEDEKEFLEYKKKEIEHDFKENKENNNPILKEKIDELPDYLFK
ncbi:20104_t:CDS:1, partial [Cetraspora pellucida]